MGRQKTLWIDEGCWKILEEMGDDSMSSKVRRCIMQFNGAHEEEVKGLKTLIEALKTQIARYDNVVRNGAKPDGWMKGDDYES